MARVGGGVIQVELVQAGLVQMEGSGVKQVGEVWIDWCGRVA
ncbi:MAG: hypothetical protein K0R75_2211, partial [Paenibacillaceae bacterium]|nr:hypothetical protein [Paenibacillaceae bacterium]